MRDHMTTEEIDFLILKVGIPREKVLGSAKICLPRMPSHCEEKTPELDEVSSGYRPRWKNRKWAVAAVLVAVFSLIGLAVAFGGEIGRIETQTLCGEGFFGNLMLGNEKRVTDYWGSGLFGGAGVGTGSFRPYRMAAEEAGYGLSDFAYYLWLEARVFLVRLASADREPFFFGLVVLLLLLILVGRQVQEQEVEEIRRRVREVVRAHGRSTGGDLAEEKSEATIQSRTAVPRVSVPPPRDVLFHLIAQARLNPDVRFKPELPQEYWSLACHSVKGNVRRKNEDYGISVRIDSCDALVIADGVGGHPYGQDASYIAAVTAAEELILRLGAPRRFQAPSTSRILRDVFDQVADRLAEEGRKRNIQRKQDGLRTTLIIVIAHKNRVDYGYIGDGGGCVIHASGQTEHFLQPQKAIPGVDHILAASLGPVGDGRPVFGQLRRSAGDLLIVGTDGVFDRVMNGFPRDIQRGAVRLQGYLQKLAEGVLSEMAAARDEQGNYLCDDNMTLGILGDCTPPTKFQGCEAK